MLEPRKADIPALFLVLVVLPVVLYILLGKWSEAAKRKGRVNLIVEEAFEESYRAEPMAAVTAVPLVVPPPNAVLWECARCGSPATTRCSRCKSARYCSGKCQIIHWRQVHKEECQPLEEADLGTDFRRKGEYPQFGDCSQLPVQERAQSDVKFHMMSRGATSTDASPATTSAALDASGMPISERKILERRVSRKSTKEMLDINNRTATNSIDPNLSSNPYPSKEAKARHKLRGCSSTNLEDGYPDMHGINGAVTADEYAGWSCTVQPSLGPISQNRDICSKRGKRSDELGSVKSVYVKEVSNCSEEAPRKNNFPHMVSSNGNSGSKTAANSECVRLPRSTKSMSKTPREQVDSTKVRMRHGYDDAAARLGEFASAHDTNGDTSSGSTKTMGLKKLSKLFRQENGVAGGSCKRVKVLFPFEEFTRFFELEVFDFAPRGLLNCGNSCYANAVLQCLTCTKPLVAFLLSRMHSRTCCLKNWCLMCELEQHVMMLKEAGGPLSPSRILSHIRGTNCQIGDGSQEDAHEFLRLLVTSMQSICLEEVGGENQVNPILQETTFVQQTFGGRLRSMVICLGCHHESERYENIMDLTLEIFGWVESLEDALTQFTTPEDLDGENMYRCGRCASYVRARKQLSIDEAPNILTIVLKRFQEGNYGKINKCITFPEMLDMVPFMTGTNDIPPLYMLYGVVVHVDTLNSSSSGHYVSYVKDPQGNWFRIDDVMVQPVSMSQVMSEGAYILFYKRSYPRPPRACIRKTIKQLAARSSRPCVSKSHNSLELGQNTYRANNRFTPSMGMYSEPNLMEFSDATSSDWSLFTSSDEASFTSESTRDSVSTADYSDTSHIDPFSSMFSTRGFHDRPSQRTISCRMFSGSQPVTRYVSEETGYIVDSDITINPPDDIRIGGNTRRVSVRFNEAYLCDNGYQDFVNHGSRSTDGFIRTFSNFQL